MSPEVTDQPRVMPHLTLAMEAEHWAVALQDGRTIDVLAHGWTTDQNDCVFSLLFKGTPNVDVPVLRIPLDLLAIPL